MGAKVKQTRPGLRRKRPRLKPGALERYARAAALSRLCKDASPACRLTPQIVNAFCDKARLGVPGSTICNFLGVSGNTFHEWVQLGAKFIAGTEAGAPDPALALYGRFVIEYRKAGAVHLMEALENFKEGDPKMNYRWMVILERRDRRNWARNEPLVNETDTMAPDERFL